jgi:serine/threonine protein kinase
LGYRYNETCDVWSVGCLIYELLFGSLLFNPNKRKRFNRDRDHVCMMIQMLGKVPSGLVKDARYASNFFKVNGQLKGDLAEIKYAPLSHDLMIKMKDQDSKQIMFTTDLLYKLLNYDPLNRPFVKDILTHSWFDQKY